MSEKSLILVTGAGRSGTSTIAGTLHHLGYHVPQPVLNTNDSNPRGFFESTWPLWFHRRIMDAAGIEQIDGRPEAAELMTAATTPAVREELSGWLAGEFAEADRVVVKDPRSAWVPGLWEDTASALGADVRYLTMLRHPAEILGSRSTYYTGPRNQMGNWAFSVMNLCGWVNINLVVERHTRDLPRAWIRYTDLLSNWRAAIDRAGSTWGIDLSVDADAARAIDAFVEPDLRRHEPTWDGTEMPDELKDVAEEVWEAGSILATSGSLTEAQRLFDDARIRYDRMYQVAVAIAKDEITAQTRRAERRARRELRRKLARRADAARQQSTVHTPVATAARRVAQAINWRRQ